MSRNELEKYFHKPITWVTRVGVKHGREVFSVDFEDGTEESIHYHEGEIEIVE